VRRMASGVLLKIQTRSFTVAAPGRGSLSLSRGVASWLSRLAGQKPGDSLERLTLQ
jgi:hypothetical protein